MRRPWFPLPALLALGVLAFCLTACSSLPPLHEAIRDNKVEKARELIAKSDNIMIRDNAGDTALHWAAHSGNVEIARLLLQKNIDLKACDNAGDTALHIAALRCNVDIAKFLLDSGLGLEDRTKAGCTPLLLACKKKEPALQPRQYAMVAFLLDRGANPNVRDHSPWTPLHYTAELDNPQLTLVLLQHKADPQLRGVNDQRPIHNAANFGKPEVAAMLFEAGSIPEILPNKPQITATTFSVTGDCLNAKRRQGEALTHYRTSLDQYGKAIRQEDLAAKQCGDAAAAAFATELLVAALTGAAAGASHSNVSYTPNTGTGSYAQLSAEEAQHKAAAKLCRDLSAKVTAKVQALEAAGITPAEMEITTPPLPAGPAPVLTTAPAVIQGGKRK